MAIAQPPLQVEKTKKATLAEREIKGLVVSVVVVMDGWVAVADNEGNPFLRSAPSLPSFLSDMRGGRGEITTRER